MAVVKQASPAAAPGAPTDRAGKTEPSSRTRGAGRDVCILSDRLHNSHMPSAAIIGAAGYTGQETLDRLLSHPALEVVALGSDSLAGRPAAALDLRLNGSLPAFVTNDEALASGADVLFVCLGHEAAARVAAPDDAVVVDLSGAHRLADAAQYVDWYGFEHPRPGQLGDWE